MAHYAIGDVHGCFDELIALLEKINFNHGCDTLWLTGDIVNRGPKSLETLQFVMQHESSVHTVLGNHDLHLLAVYYGEGKVKRSDTLSSILNHPNSDKMLEWLKSQPLMIQNNQYVMVHAGLLPQWNVDKAHALASEVEYVLQSNKADKYFSKMYSNKPSAWSDDLDGYERLRMITNVFTRMRALTFTNELEYDYKSTVKKMPLYLRPWFKAANRQHLSHNIIFGHWSALGYINADHVISLDTGALWGGELTAINLDTQQVTQVVSQSKLDWATALGKG